MSRERRKDQAPRVLPPKPSDLPMPAPAELLAEATKPGVRKRNGMKAVALPAAVRALHELASPALREATLLAQDWLYARVAEVYGAHGSAGVGVCALLERAAEAYAWSWYFGALAREHDTKDREASANYAQKSAQQAQFARQQELAAWEVAAREGKAARELEARKNRGKSALLAAQEGED